jgi:hypothetical protein
VYNEHEVGELQARVLIGNVMEAMNVYRQIYRVDLGNAKKAVEELKARLKL